MSEQGKGQSPPQEPECQGGMGFQNQHDPILSEAATRLSLAETEGPGDGDKWLGTEAEKQKLEGETGSGYGRTPESWSWKTEGARPERQKPKKKRRRRCMPQASWQNQGQATLSLQGPLLPTDHTAGTNCPGYGKLTAWGNI